MCFVWLSEQTVTFAIYIINRLVFITEVESVYSAVRTESLYKTNTPRPLKVNLNYTRPARTTQWTRFLLSHTHTHQPLINLLKPNDIYICRTAALTSRRNILNIYSTNIHTEYFKHAALSPFFLQNVVYFIMLTCLVPVLFAFYLQGVLKFKCKIPAPNLQCLKVWRKSPTKNKTSSFKTAKALDLTSQNFGSLDRQFK